VKKAKLVLVASPKALPDAPGQGRVVLVDLAFASGSGFETGTLSWLRRHTEQLAGWIDHHDHLAWPEYQTDSRFVLVPRSQAPACPELVSPALVRELGPIDELFAHADFDGCVTAAKYLKGGISPYEQADEDARAIDSPGQGYRCSDRGLRLARAMDQLRDGDPDRYLCLLNGIVDSLVTGEEPERLSAEIDELVRQRMEHEQRLQPMADQAVYLHEAVLVLRVDKKLPSADRKLLLRLLEQRALVGIVREPKWTTAATFQAGLDLGSVPGLRGLAGYAGGEARPEDVLQDIVELIEEV
jgi:hypothetical protein